MEEEETPAKEDQNEEETPAKEADAEIEEKEGD